MIDRIAEIKARLKAATPGPWTPHDNHGVKYVSNGKDGRFAKFDNRICEAAFNLNHPPINENMSLIAHAPSDLAYLIEQNDGLEDNLAVALDTLRDEGEENNRLWDENERMRKALQDVNEYFEWEKEAWEKSWCQDGSRRMFAEEVVRKCLAAAAIGEAGDFITGFRP